MNGYQLTRQWFDFAYSNNEVKPQHTALYCWCVELNNRLQWKESFGLPTDEACEYTGIGNRNTFYSAFNDLKNWGFIKEIKSSINQNQSRIISLRLSEIDQAEMQAEVRHCSGSIASTATIDKQYKQLNNKNNIDISPKVKKKKEKVEFIPPTIQEVYDFFTERFYPLQLVEKVYNHYNDKQWHKSNGQPVIDWKATIRNNWEDHFQSWRQRQNSNVGNSSSHLPVEPSKIVNYGKGNGKCFQDNKSKLWYEPNNNGTLPKEISDYYSMDQGNHSNYGDYVRWMIENNKTPMPPEDMRYYPADWNFEKFVAEQKAIVASSIY